MGHKTERHNFRVEVYPDSPRFSLNDVSEKEWEIVCGHIEEQVKRHVDGLPRHTKTATVWDTERTCEHCGYGWTEGKDSPHNGGCCDEDAKVMEEYNDAQ